MNRLEYWFCATSFWRRMTQKELLPWLLAGTELGEHVLEIGAGAGAATEELRKRAGRVTSLEYSREMVTKLACSGTAGRSAVLQGDATQLPFSDQTFSAVIAVLMLHHLRSREAQGRALAEAFRVLRPDGAFLAVEIGNSWFNRLVHIRSTFVPISAAEFPGRLAAAGFASDATESRNGVFRIKGVRREERDESCP